MLTTTRWGIAGVAMVVGLGAGFWSPTEARNSGKVKLDLTATTLAPMDARGKVSVDVRGATKGKLVVVAKKLARDTAYDVLLAGVRIGGLATSGGGNGKANFRSVPHSSKDQLLGTDPHGMTLVVRSGSGDDVLVADIPDRLDPTPDDSSDDDIACCLDDDDGPECEDRTEAECLARGGVSKGATSCLPNPCGDSASGAHLNCCIPDDSDDEGGECEDRTAAACAAEGGLAVGGAVCTPELCEPTTSEDGDEIQCCLPDDNGTECEDRSLEACLALGGTSMGPGTCTPNPCTP